MVLLIYGVRLPPLCQKPHINLLGRVTDQVFSESEEWDIDTVSETIASEYERATNLSINKEKQNLPIEEKRTIDVKEIRELSLIHISEPTRPNDTSRMPSSA